MSFKIQSLGGHYMRFNSKSTVRTHFTCKKGSRVIQGHALSFYSMNLPWSLKQMFLFVCCWKNLSCSYLETPAGWTNWKPRLPSSFRSLRSHILSFVNGLPCPNLDHGLQFLAKKSNNKLYFGMPIHSSPIPVSNRLCLICLVIFPPVDVAVSWANTWLISLYVELYFHGDLEEGAENYIRAQLNMVLSRAGKVGEGCPALKWETLTKGTTGHFHWRYLICSSDYHSSEINWSTP